MRSNSFSFAVPTEPLPEKPVPFPEKTYVVQLPKCQILREASPRRRRGSLCNLCCIIALALFVFIALTAVHHFLGKKVPKFSLDGIVVRGINMTSTDPVSTECDVTFGVLNGNGNVGVYYKGTSSSSVNVYFSQVNICNGKIPAFYQPPNNLTVLHVALKGSSVILETGDLMALKERTVPLKVKLAVPVKLKVGSHKTWTIMVKYTWTSYQ